MKHETLTFRFLDMSRGGVARLFLLLLLPCLSVIGVKADSNGGVKFNSGVRYSQWAINSRLYDFRGNQKAYGFKKWNSGTESLEEYANKKNMKLDYVAGLVGKATLEASDYYVDFDWAKPWFKSAQAYATDYDYSRFKPDQTKMTLDNMNAAKMAFHIINNSKWGEDAAKTAAKKAIEAIITDLKYYNEYNVIGGTNSEVKEATANDVQKKMLGGWFHKYNYVDQVWCDGMYMGPALLAQLINYKKATNNVSNDDWSLLTKQFSITWEQLRDSKTGLLYHGMTATPTITDWSKDTTPTSYHSGAFWGRANAWYMLALVDVLELMPTSNTNYSTLKGYLEKLAASIASYQNADGTWYQVLDQKDNALDGNYEESSCSALFTAAYLKALRLKLLESSKYETMAKKAYVALVNKFMAYDKDDNNKIQILGSCCSAGLGTNNNKLRDGSRSYYINGNDSKVVTGENTGYYYTEGKVLGGFIMAATEYERAYQNQDSKQILFAKDLAPSYDLSTAVTLDATAYGSGDVTYQWYKDGKAIADATDATPATYTPTESGSYYCEATANGNTIKTSETTVTAKSNSNTDKGKIKPVFLESFKGITINLHQDSKNRTITVPLIHNGEDVSSYFIYTYKVTAKANGQIQEFTENTLNYTPSTAGTYTVTVSATPDPNGTNDYSDVYDSPDPIEFTLNVDRKYQTISVTPDPTSIKMYAGTQVAPGLTVKKGNATLADTDYKTSWFSTSPGVAKVDATTGNIEAVSEGTANIRVVVTGDNLESTTALISVEVDDPAVYRVKGTDKNHGNQTRMWNQHKTMSVVLGGWLFPNPVATNGPTSPTQGPSTEGLSAKYHWGPGATKAKWKLTGFDYYVAGDNNKNARQENGSNALPETTNIYSADFVKYKGTIKDKMFNVPCSGSYLEFNPVTNGKVTVHIFQNGVFDAKTEKNNKKTYQYRPQRRVFVMDEAGNFVESTAHIESTNGKPTGGIQTIDKYTWDLDSKTLTIEDVRSHFKGIPTTFEMTTDGFKNNVYESLLSNELVPNAAAGKGNGSLGWSVLADSPVTYTFKVKAGKTYYLYNFGSKIGFYGFSFDEGETKPVEDEVSYAENQANTITATAAGHVAKVTVNRKMTAGIWTTCVLPFSLNRQQVDAIFGPAYSAAYPQGTQILYFDRVENGKVYFVRHAYNTIVANKPFLIKPSKKVESISTAAVDEYPYVTIEATKNENGKPDDWCTGNGYTWASSYSNDMIVKEGDGFISNQDGTFKNFVGASGTLKGFRGYLKRLGTQTGAKPIMLQVVNSSNVDGDNGETTGIEDLIIDADGQLMPANGKVYNINGQLVSEDANSFQSLPSGIYIINGKKYIK